MSVEDIGAVYDWELHELPSSSRRRSSRPSLSKRNKTAAATNHPPRHREESRKENKLVSCPRFFRRADRSSELAVRRLSRIAA